MNKKLLFSVAIFVILIAIINVIMHLKSNPVAELSPSPILFPSISASPNSLGSKSNLIRVTSPQPNQTVSKSLNITGEARGTWYFEASFPIHLKDAAGKTIASTTASAKSDWMTTDFVPFEANLIIPATFNGQATLVLSKDNPSGLPQNADSLEIPITISKQ